MARIVTIDAGELDRLATLQQASTDQVETSGFPKQTWEDLATIPVGKKDSSARERFNNNQFSAAFDSVFVMRYRADMDPELVDVPKMRRIVYRGRIYNIVAASQINRYEGMELFTLASTRIA